MARLQSALQGQSDGVFGARTEAAVAAHQRRAGLPVSGRAGAREYQSMRVPWPSEFERCMALVSCLEGTSFGDCNSADIDGAGVTLGIVGFTTAHGEVQELIAALVRENELVLDYLTPGPRRELARMIELNIRDRGVWERWFYGPDKRVRPEVRAALQGWGALPAMRSLQLDMARERFWAPAVRCAQRLGLVSGAARGLLLDVWVQNGGWCARHEKRLREIGGNGDLGERGFEGRGDGFAEKQLLELMAHAVSDCAKKRWRDDVMQRKLLFARGKGLVHGRGYCLVEQAIRGG